MRALVLALVLLLAACGTTEVLVPVEVLVPLPVPCEAQVSPSPQYPDTDEALRAEPDLFERVKRLLAGRELRTAREAELERAVAVCQGADV